LHLRALLAELPLEQLETRHAPLPAPRAFAVLVLRSLAATSTSAQRIARAAAVLGQRASLEEIAAVAGVDDSAHVVPALEELHKARILRLRETSTGWQVRFHHPLVKAAVYDDLGPDTRAALHTRAAERLH